jgi:RHS repeat-associated protein
MYIYISNEGEELVDVFFDDLKVVHEKSSIVQHDDYYPFGLTFNSYQRENATPNRWKFQGQEHIDDLGLNWDSFKWRNHQPDIGRFFNVDPLAEKYAYNSTYAFCENKVTSHVELEGLEAVAFQVEGRGIVPVYGNLSVTASGAYGIVVGTRQGQDGIYAVQYVSGSLGPASGVGLAGGIGTYVHSGDLEDISGFGFGIGGFLGPTPTGLTGGSFELNTTTDGTQLGGLIPFASPGRAFGGGVWAEFSYTEFLDEPIRLTDMTEEATARLAESLGISVEQFTEFVNNATEYINSQQSQHQNELPSVEDIQKELEQKLIVPSDATRVNTN